MIAIDPKVAATAFEQLDRLTAEVQRHIDLLTQQDHEWRQRVGLPCPCARCQQAPEHI